MFVAKVIDGQIVDSGNLKFMFPDTSFPASGPDQEWMDENGIRPVKSWIAHDASTHRLNAVAPYLDGDDVYTVEVVSLTEEEIAGNLASVAARVRSDRNARLTASDWTQLQDAPLTAEERQDWADYRQALRDISLQSGFPTQVDFPLRPGEVPMQMLP